MFRFVTVSHAAAALLVSQSLLAQPENQPPPTGRAAEATSDAPAEAAPDEGEVETSNIDADPTAGAAVAAVEDAPAVPTHASRSAAASASLGTEAADTATPTEPAGTRRLDEAPPAPVDSNEADAEPATAGYDKGFFIRSTDEPYSLKINVMIQPRFTWEGVEHGRDEAQLAVKRARLKLTGKAFDDDLDYFFQADFGSGAVKLMDFFLDYGIVPGKLHVRLGQWRRPFSREFINAVTKLELVDRSIADKAFGANRDIGFAIHNRYEKSPQFEWVLGAYNGTGYGSRFTGNVVVDTETGEGDVTSGKFSNVPNHFHPMVVGRVGYNYNGLVGYSQGDLEGGAPRFGVGVGGLVDGDADGGDDSLVQATADVLFKAYGFSAGLAGFASSQQQGDEFADRGLEAVGFALQGGYVIAERFQPVARWSVVFPEDDADIEEILGGLSVYLKKHRLKWQTDAGVIAEEVPGENEITPVVRSQLQAVF